MPLSTRQVMDFRSKVSIVLISTFSLRDVRLCSAVAMKYFLGSAFSHFNFHIFRAVAGVGAGICFSGFCMSGNMVSELHIFDSISKQLLVDSEGMLFTHCLVQNPSPILGLLFLSLLCPFWPLFPFPALLQTTSWCHICWGSQEPYVRFYDTCSKWGWVSFALVWHPYLLVLG